MNRVQRLTLGSSTFCTRVMRWEATAQPKAQALHIVFRLYRVYRIPCGPGTVCTGYRVYRI
eukprot:509443-Prymnesium_polylepis.1